MRRAAAEREEGRITDYTPYRDLYVEFETMEKRAIVSDGSEAPEEIATRLRAAIKAGTYLLT